MPYGPPGLIVGPLGPMWARGSHEGPNGPPNGAWKIALKIGFRIIATVFEKLHKADVSRTGGNAISGKARYINMKEKQKVNKVKWSRCVIIMF